MSAAGNSRKFCALFAIRPHGDGARLTLRRDVDVDDAFARRIVAGTRGADRAIRIGSRVVKHRKQPAVFQGQQARDQFDRPAPRAKISEITFGGRDRNRFAAVAKTS